ncbi:MAG: hypothetical protein RDU20_07110 [Desulfomonilaceae bacterium]|nr:hypothetical protein [Desulfomonilaceae bacterium]
MSQESLHPREVANYSGNRQAHTRRNRIILSAALASVLLLVYLFLNTSFSFRFTERPGVPNYEMLAESFLSGQLHLKQPVDPSRLKAHDPLDPSLPYPYLMDGLIFNGKYYFQHEPLPAIFRVLSVKLTGTSYSTGSVVVLSVWLSFLSMGSIMWKIRQVVWPSSRVWVFYYVWAGFGISGPQLYLAGAPVVYNESMAMGCAFLLAGSYFLLRGLVDRRHTTMNFALSGILFGSSIGCRAELAIYPITFCFLYFAWSLTRGGEFWLRSKQLCVLAVPVSIFGTGLLTYNYLRFGSFFDFGRSHLMFPRYITYVHTILHGDYFSLRRIPFQLYHYLLALPAVTEKFPYLRYPFGDLIYGDVYIYLQLACSIFITTPLLLLCLVLPWYFKYLPKGRSLRLPAIACLLSSVTTLVMVSTTVGSLARYMSAFTPLLYVSVFGALVGIDHKLRPALDHSKGTIGILALLFAGQLFMGLLLGLTGVVQFPPPK